MAAPENWQTAAGISRRFVIKESDPPSLQRALLLLFSSGQPRHFMPYLGNRSYFTTRENSWLGEFNGTRMWNHVKKR